MENQQNRFRTRVGEATDMLDNLYGENRDDEALSRLESFLKDQESGRAFFVSWLTGEWALEGSPADMTLERIKEHNQILADIMVKNLVMPAAMALTHRKNGDPEMEKESLRVKERTALVLEKVMDEHLKARLSLLKEAIKRAKENSNPGSEEQEFDKFLKRWRYDINQLDEMEKSIEALST